MNKQMNPAIEKMQRNAFVKNAFKQFKSFINNDSLSDDFDIDVLKHNIGTSLARHHFKNGRHIVLADKNLHLVKELSLPYLFHEFTHIWDGETYFAGDANQACFLYLFTEYHASQIQMMKYLGFENIFDKKVIHLTDEVVDLISTTSLKDYLENKQLDYAKDIAKMDIQGNMENFLKACAFFMYYMGYLSVAKKYSDNDFTALSDMSVFADTLGDTVYEIAELFDIIEPVTNDKLVGLANCQLKIMKRFGL